MKRVYFIFKINKTFSYIYYNKPYKIYKILEEIYFTKNYDIMLTYKSFNEVANCFHKMKLNEYIYNSYKYKSFYERKDNSHFIIGEKEITKLVVNNSNIKIRTTVNKPLFFNFLSQDETLFVCDFVNKDYFWLHKITECSRQIDKNIVK